MMANLSKVIRGPLGIMGKEGFYETIFRHQKVGNEERVRATCVLHVCICVRVNRPCLCVPVWECTCVCTCVCEGAQTQGAGAQN